MEEIIHHRNQKDIFEFLKEQNENCLTCRWVHQEKCSNLANENFNKNLTEIEDKSCEDKHHIVDTENYKKQNDDANNLFNIGELQ